MKFKIENALFVGFCGENAAISQGKQVRLFNHYNSITKKLMERQHVLSTFTCEMDEDGTAWIREIERPEEDE